MSTAKVYSAIAAVSAAMAKDGIGKDRRNATQGYNFRGIDDVYNALAPILAEHKLCILPRMVSRECVERVSAKGGALFYTTVEAEFDFVSAEDGSTHTIRTFGEAMDSADKSTNKAMSAAYKYAAMQTFCIPTEGDNDADASHHEVAPREQPRQTEPEGGWAFWANELIGRINSARNDAAISAIINEPATADWSRAVANVDKVLFESIGNAVKARKKALKSAEPMKEAA